MLPHIAPQHAHNADPGQDVAVELADQALFGRGVNNVLAPVAACRASLCDVCHGGKERVGMGRQRCSQAMLRLLYHDRLIAPPCTLISGVVLAAMALLARWRNGSSQMPRHQRVRGRRVRGRAAMDTVGRMIHFPSLSCHPGHTFDRCTSIVREYSGPQPNTSIWKRYWIKEPSWAPRIVSSRHRSAS